MRFLASMLVSDLRVAGQVGSTIALGLLFDTLVIRSFMTPSIAALMGRWFWWPQVVRQRPVSQPWPSPAASAEPATTEQLVLANQRGPQ
jgi:RND superfamily putative drug exporter